MRLSSTIKSNATPSTSPDGQFIAAIVGQNIEIRQLETFQVLRTIAIESRKGVIKWPNLKIATGDAFRLLLQTSDDIRVWDLGDPKWSSTLTNGSGGMGKIVNAEFGPSKHELVLIHDFGSKVTIWSLVSGRSVEIRDPKTSVWSYEFRPNSGHLAFLSRPAAQDILTVHNTESYSVMKSVVLQTLDAQGLKWSPDGKWLAIWDTPSTGTKIHIFTADGSHYRTVVFGDDTKEVALGVKTLCWNPNSDQLAIGDFNQNVTILSTRTFSPIMTLKHHQTINMGSCCVVWQELSANKGRNRSYQRAPQPIALPAASSANPDATSKIGISTLVFNSNGTLLATRDDAMPSTVWIWNLTSHSLEAVIIQLSTVRRLLWHPKIPELLNIQVELDESPFVLLWRQDHTEPLAVSIPFERSSGRIDMRWVNSLNDSPVIFLNDNQHSLFCWPFQSPINVNSAMTVEDGDESIDSVYQALIGNEGMISP